MSIPKEFFDSLDPVEKEKEIAAGFGEALKSGGRVTTPSGLTVQVVEPPPFVKIGLRIDWDTAVRLAGLEPETWSEIATIEEVLEASRRNFPTFLEEALTRGGYS